ncbi:hypothetical protein MUP32_00050 [Candidatus Microgenomates bacterium]|nr:hypothetical protein [Candidatus Microgenomates bacterium]
MNIENKYVIMTNDMGILKEPVDERRRGLLIGPLAAAAGSLDKIPLEFRHAENTWVEKWLGMLPLDRQLTQASYDRRAAELADQVTEHATSLLSHELYSSMSTLAQKIIRENTTDFSEIGRDDARLKFTAWTIHRAMYTNDAACAVASALAILPEDEQQAILIPLTNALAPVLAKTDEALTFSRETLSGFTGQVRQKRALVTPQPHVTVTIPPGIVPMMEAYFYDWRQQKHLQVRSDRTAGLIYLTDTHGVSNPLAEVEGVTVADVLTSQVMAQALPAGTHQATMEFSYSQPGTVDMRMVFPLASPTDAQRYLSVAVTTNNPNIYFYHLLTPGSDNAGMFSYHSLFATLHSYAENL